MWEYLFVEADWHGKGFLKSRGSWRVRWINDVEQPGWQEGKLFNHYLNELGAEGWEIVAYSFAPEYDANGARVRNNRRPPNLQSEI